MQNAEMRNEDIPGRLALRIPGVCYLDFCFRALWTCIRIIYVMDDVKNFINFTNPSSWCPKDQVLATVPY